MRQIKQKQSLNELFDFESVLPLIQQWLLSGISKENIASSVRVNGIEQYSGGMKSDFVASINMNISAVIKNGTEELKLHQQLMNGVNLLNSRQRRERVGLQKAIFPEVMAVKGIEGKRKSKVNDDSTHLMLMQELVKYDSLEYLLYQGNLDSMYLISALSKAMKMCRLIHSVTPEESRKIGIRNLPITRAPFSNRIENLLSEITRQDPQLESLWCSPGRVQNRDCPSLSVLIGALRSWEEKKIMHSSTGVWLVHGDPHIGNIMVRRRGKNSSVRLIDPNPTIGFSNPVYDYGKLLHFVEPVGWIRHHGRCCYSSWEFINGGWVLNGGYGGVPGARESIRLKMESLINQEAQSRGYTRLELKVATASAHLGLARINAVRGNRKETRYALAYALKALADWCLLEL